jgi:hypothetical protein
MTARLANDLDEIASLLESDGDKHWSAWLREDAAALKNGDLRGAQHFLSAFGGMGSINDSYGFSATHKKEEDLSLDEQIARRLDTARVRARALVRAAEAS